MIIGAQLYTAREFCKDLENLSETLKKVADIGYKTVQLSGTCDCEPQWFKEQLDANGLKCVLTHTRGDRIIADPKKVCDEHKVYDCRNIGLGMISGGRDLTEEKYLKFVADFKPAAKEIAANGCKFFFHNHCEEFTARFNGKSCIDRMLEDFAPEELNFTLDTYWVQYAGCDTCEYLERLKGRVECIHLKDMAVDPATWGHRMAPIGSGNMNFPKIINVAGDCGTEYLIVEQDNCYGEDPFECLKRSYNYLRSLGLE